MSVALGAFFAGLIVGQSRIGPQAAADMAPFRDVFSALFFVSIGMLFNPSILVDQTALFGLALAIVLVVKPLVALGIVLLLRDTLRTGLTVAVGLSQIGEFSFILAALGVSLKIFPQEGTDILVAAAIASIALNPLLFRAMPWMEQRFGRPRRVAMEQGAKVTAAEEQGPQSPSAAPTPIVLCGLNELGHRFLQRALTAGARVTVVDSHLERLEAWRDRVPTVYGDAGRMEVLEAANTATARAIVLTSGALHEKMRVCTLARQLNPRIAILATAESEAERAWLNEFGVQFVSSVHDEMSDALLRAVRRVL
jgi:CPA2 family monovalent cation:H+ antiporter-2